ncbi:MAG: hypothetical protein ACOCVF_00055 [bacterium]
MALLRCDECGSNDTNCFGSWDTPIKIICKNCAEKKNIKTVENIEHCNGDLEDLKI